jgi:hypothetical protein
MLFKRSSGKKAINLGATYRDIDPGGTVREVVTKGTPAREHKVE